ncbi:MAG: tRNA 2-thiouridine(34) synthase MnmA [Clostridiales bacterium]|nr:tRNA 2-thiouridine(34) synthase MnmA [Clostridiales bacterium]
MERIMQNTTVVGMSGGVDSSVAALLLKKQGVNCVGVFMKNWEENEDSGLCTSTEDYSDVRQTAALIGIPYYTVNFAKEYYERVFTYFLEEYKAGRTPNPDVLCNCEIKFKAFLEFALKSGATALATGHYAKTEHTTDGVKLLKAKDKSKDQTYFLAGLNQQQLEKAVFPLGDLLKSEVRQIAFDAGLINANKKDSTGICFIGERNFKQFLMQYLPAQKGDIVDIKGNVLGKHDGLMFYTLGQRRGLGIGGQKTGSGESFFVVEKDMEKNRLIVMQGEGRELYSKALETSKFHFILGNAPKTHFRCMAKFRYRQPDTPVTVTVEQNSALIEFDELQRAITPGQYAVLYNGEECLGCGVIERVIK